MTTRSKCVVSLGGAAAVVIGLLTAAPAGAADWTFRPFEFPATYTADFGARFWYGQGTTAKNLYGSTGANLGLAADLQPTLRSSRPRLSPASTINNGWFAQGLCRWRRPVRRQAQGRGLSAGDRSLFGDLELQPTTARHLRQHRRRLQISARRRFPCRRLRRLPLLRETVNAYGCSQIAANPNDLRRHSGHLQGHHAGQQLELAAASALDAAMSRSTALKLSLDAAYLPYVQLHGATRIGAHRPDQHDRRRFQRCRFPRTAPAGASSSRPSLSYRLTDVSQRRRRRPLLAHGRPRALTHFEGHVVGGTALPQPVTWKTDNLRRLRADQRQARALSVISDQLASAGSRLTLPLRAMRRRLVRSSPWTVCCAPPSIPGTACSTPRAARRPSGRNWWRSLLAVPLAFFVATEAWKRLALIGVGRLGADRRTAQHRDRKARRSRVHAAIDPQIGRVKDMGSAAVGLALLDCRLRWLLALAERLGLL